MKRLVLPAVVMMFVAIASSVSSSVATADDRDSVPFRVEKMAKTLDEAKVFCWNRFYEIAPNFPPNSADILVDEGGKSNSAHFPWYWRLHFIFRY